MSIRIFAAAAVFAFAIPQPLAAHVGHAGDHGFLFGALQPLLSVDHLVAGVVVAGAVAVGIVGVVRVVTRWSFRRRSHRA